MPPCLQLIFTAMLLGTVGTVAMVAGTPEWPPKRRAMLAVLRVALAFSPVFRMHARFVMQASHAVLCCAVLCCAAIAVLRLL